MQFIGGFQVYEKKLQDGDFVIIQNHIQELNQLMPNGKSGTNTEQFKIWEHNTGVVTTLYSLTELEDYPCVVINIPDYFLPTESAFALPKGSKVIKKFSHMSSYTGRDWKCFGVSANVSFTLHNSLGIWEHDMHC